MNASAITQPKDLNVECPTKHRIASIDILRGLTMMVMVFVNDLDGVEGMPWWTHHAHGWENRMTYVDMVFPFFLFLVGMSMPLAIDQRLRRRPSHLALWQHIVARSAGLISLGLILANAASADRAHMPLSSAAWGLLGLLGGVLLGIAPAREAKYRIWVSAARICGACVLVSVFAVYRRVDAHGHVLWVDGSYPEILGLIGYAYFASSVLYVPTRRWKWSPLFWFVFATVWCAYCTAHHDTSLLHLPNYLWPFGNGSSVSLIFAGIFTSNLFFEQGRTVRSKNLRASALAFATLVVGIVLSPLGISKIRATPTWCLYTIAAAIMLFMLLHWVCDVRGRQRWATWLKPAGTNTLLTYLLPDLYYFATLLVGFGYFGSHLHQGVPGVCVTLFFTLAILAASAFLTKVGLRLQL
ncbi:DUF5009 domain-containing protein [Acidipila sp. EB88]|uniref:DUF5009 domain-containing protein n=1 Tax=Acidipila sp. EB88 TaxID=2305226 RepID=UPI000F5E01A2|nr:DUF5009 domain-containing protein [Acidipila sp. EB88]RRA47651.1 DUF5009 domain-containing protein [Acidipila sp. EB88]